MKKKTDARQDKGLKVHYVNELIKEIFVHFFFLSLRSLLVYYKQMFTASTVESCKIMYRYFIYFFFVNIRRIY